MGLSELNSLDSALDRFLQKEIAIPTNARQDASRSHIYLRNVLRGKGDNDATFPEILALEDSDFLGGSFARHTKIWPLDDIDVFLPLEGGGLVYRSGGQVLPYRLATDGEKSRLCLPMWLTNSYVDSAKVLQGFVSSLRDTYPSSKIGRDGHCANLQTTVAATSESDGIGFDIVPCFMLKPDDGSEDIYLVPNGNGGWMHSNPRKDTEICSTLQEYHRGTYRHAVRLLKYWNKFEFADRFRSYYIELAVSKIFNEYMISGKPITHVSQAFTIAFSALVHAHAAGAAKPLVSGAPDVPAPVLSTVELGILTADANRADNSFNDAWKGNNLASALATLNTIFLSAKYFK